MMTKSVFTGLSLLVAVSVLASCGPQKRAPDIKSTKIGIPGQQGASPSSQVQTDKQKIEDTKMKIPQLAPHDRSIVNAITAVSSTKKANGLHIQLFSADGDIEVLIPDDSKAKIETNAISASAKCQQNVKSVADCDNLQVTFSMAVFSDTAAKVKTLVVQRNLFRDVNVLRVLGGKEEVQGAALVEVMGIASAKDKEVSESKTFASVEIIGTDLTRSKKQISSTVINGSVTFKVDVYGLPENINGTNILYSDLISAKDENKVMEFQEKNTGMRLKVEYTKKFDMKDYKPTEVSASANQTVVDPAVTALKANKAAIANAEAIAKEDQTVRENIAEEKKAINPRDRN